MSLLFIHQLDPPLLITDPSFIDYYVASFIHSSARAGCCCFRSAQQFLCRALIAATAAAAATRLFGFNNSK